MGSYDKMKKYNMDFTNAIRDLSAALDLTDEDDDSDIGKHYPKRYAMYPRFPTNRKRKVKKKNKKKKKKPAESIMNKEELKLELIENLLKVNKLPQDKRKSEEVKRKSEEKNEEEKDDEEKGDEEKEVELAKPAKERMIESIEDIDIENLSNPEALMDPSIISNLIELLDEDIEEVVEPKKKMKNPIYMDLLKNVEDILKVGGVCSLKNDFAEDLWNSTVKNLKQKGIFYGSPQTEEDKPFTKIEEDCVKEMLRAGKVRYTRRCLRSYLKHIGGIHQTYKFRYDKLDHEQNIRYRKRGILHAPEVPLDTEGPTYFSCDDTGCAPDLRPEKLLPDEDEESRTKKESRNSKKASTLEKKLKALFRM